MRFTYQFRPAESNSHARNNIRAAGSRARRHDSTNSPAHGNIHTNAIAAADRRADIATGDIDSGLKPRSATVTGSGVVALIAGTSARLVESLAVSCHIHADGAGACAQRLCHPGD